MPNSTPETQHRILSPDDFLSLVDAGGVELREPSEELLFSLINKIVATSAPAPAAGRQLLVSPN